MDIKMEDKKRRNNSSSEKRKKKKTKKQSKKAKYTKKNDAILREYSIDSLLASREFERQSGYSNEFTPNSSPIALEAIPQISIEHLISRDGSVYNFTQGSFPYSIFDSYPELNKDSLPLFPSLTNDQLSSVLYHIKLYPPNQVLFFFFDSIFTYIT